MRQAELDLEFTELRAPVNGRIGDRRVSPGNLVTGGTSGNTTLLATIVSTDPIRFEFTFDEASYLRYERLAKDGDRTSPAATPASRCALKLIDENEFDHEGRMDFVDNVIDRSTGTIRGRAVFANADGVFTPGMFARVRVPASPPYEALLVPDMRHRHRAGAQVRRRGQRRQYRDAEIRDARPAHVGRSARHQGGHRPRRSRHRQRSDAGAARHESARRRSRARAGCPAPAAGAPPQTKK